MLEYFIKYLNQINSHMIPIKALYSVSIDYKDVMRNYKNLLIFV